MSKNVRRADFEENELEKLWQVAFIQTIIMFLNRNYKLGYNRRSIA